MIFSLLWLSLLSGSALASTCSDLAVSDCKLNYPECQVLHGFPASQVCDDQNDLVKVPAGCIDSDTLCAPAITFAQPSELVAPLAFPSACIPQGWKAVDQGKACSVVAPAVESKLRCSSGTVWGDATTNSSSQIDGCQMGACLEACGKACSSSARCLIELARNGDKYYTCINGEVWKARATASDIC